MQHAYAALMDSPRQSRRRAKLQEVIAAFPGGAAALGRHVGTPKSHISAILAGRRGVGDALAAKFARAHKKPADWMDEPEHAITVTDEEREVLNALRAARATKKPATEPQPAAPQNIAPANTPVLQTASTLAKANPALERKKGTM